MKLRILNFKNNGNLRWNLKNHIHYLRTKLYILFISFIDDVSGVIHFFRFHIYADDLQIYHSSSVADLQRRNFGFVLNRNLTLVDHYKAVCQRIYSVLRSVKPYARYTPFRVRKKLVVSLIMHHINYGNVVFSTVDSASQRRLNVAFNSCLRYVHDISRREHVSHLVPTIIGVSLATHLKVFV
jgi:hypothetical protein